MAGGSSDASVEARKRKMESEAQVEEVGVLVAADWGWMGEWGGVEWNGMEGKGHSVIWGRRGVGFCVDGWVHGGP